MDFLNDQWPGTARINRQVQMGAGILLGRGFVLIPLTIVLLYGPVSVELVGF